MVSFRAALATGLMLALPAAANVDGHVMAEVGVHNIEAKSRIIRRDVSKPKQNPNAPDYQVEAQKRARERARAAAEAADKAQTHKLDESETTSTEYADSVLASKPVVYWHLNELTGTKIDGDGPACGPDDAMAFGDLCLVAGNIHGTPKLGEHSLIPVNTRDKAIHFDGTHDQEIVIPDSAFINTNDTGYEARTVELWFKADDPGHTPRVIFEEGNEAHAGINMYISNTAHGLELFMYGWDRGVNEVEFGTELLEPNPLRCHIEKDVPYYTALVFNQANRSLTGYLKRPHHNVEICGQILELPRGAKLRHHGHMNGNAIIGGVLGTTRGAGKSHAIMDDVDMHNFIGTIDEVAIYNRALPQLELQKHATVAGNFDAKVGEHPHEAAHEASHEAAHEAAHEATKTAAKKA